MSGKYEGPFDHLDLLASGELNPDDITAALENSDHELKLPSSAARHAPGETMRPTPEFLSVIPDEQV